MNATNADIAADDPPTFRQRPGADDDRSPNNASVIAKVRMIVEALPGPGDVVSVSELAREIGLSKSTVSRICAELVEWGIVARVGQAVSLGPRLSQLGALAPFEAGSASHALLSRVAHPIMVDLFVEVRRAVTLSVMAGADTLCIGRVTGTAHEAASIRVGDRGPAHLTAAGRAMLAYGSDADVNRVLGRPLRRLTRYSMVNRELLVRELRDIRESGIATIHEEMRLGRSSMAVPVFSPASGAAVAAIAVSRPEGDQTSADERALRRCGAAVNAALRRVSGAGDPDLGRTEWLLGSR